MPLAKVFYENKTIEDERLELSDRQSLYFLGNDLVLKNCTLVLKVAASNLVIRQAQFVGCSFDVKKELVNYQQWLFASLKGCRLKGSFSGCDFGSWPDYSHEAKYGSIEDCDFSEARLHGCRFMGCDNRSLRFPRWPCFTLVEPLLHGPELSRVQWPGIFGEVVVKNLHMHPKATVALTYHAPSLAKKFKTSDDELKAVLEKFDFVVM